MPRKPENHDAGMIGRRTTANIGETQVGTEQAEAVLHRVLGDPRIARICQTNVADVDSLVAELLEQTGHRSRKIGIDQEPQCGSGQRDRVGLFGLDELAGVSQCSPDVFIRDAVIGAYLRRRGPTRQRMEDSVHGNSRSPNHRLAVSDCRVDDDSVIHWLTGPQVRICPIAHLPCQQI